MKTRRNKRVAAIAMALLMVVGMMPTDIAVTRVMAADTTADATGTGTEKGTSADKTGGTTSGETVTQAAEATTQAAEGTTSAVTQTTAAAEKNTAEATTAAETTTAAVTKETTAVQGTTTATTATTVAAKTFSLRAVAAETTTIYVSPTGTSGGDGSKENPVDIYTAMSSVSAGKTILLAGGTYSLSATVKADKDKDGTSEAKIVLKADPEASERPVLDFSSGTCAGLVLAGDYWEVSGFDVTGTYKGTADVAGEKGIQLSGSHCLLEELNTYRNGNTGLQVSGSSSDSFDAWPHDNTIKNCNSYYNADAKVEDGDGFAAKLTVGNGNVFDGCISYNNLDDGWDLFAKDATGSIGAVTIKNCVAYNNGRLSDGSLSGGDGNGFKLGGSSISGKHVLENSIAYNNVSKGIDSNSGPDVIVKNCTSFNNEKYNVALYTSTAENTDYSASGVLSFRTDNTTVYDNLALKGTQDASKVYQTSDYYWAAEGTDMGAAHNANGTVAADWFKSVEAPASLSRNEDGSINMNGFLTLTAKAAAGAGAEIEARETAVPSTENPLTTIWKTKEVGTHEGNGSYVYDSSAKTITVTGAGTKFDKNAGIDDLYYVFANAKGDLTISAKVAFTNDGTAGYAGLILRNASDEAGSPSAGLYADYANGSKDQIRYGYHKENTGGGASRLNNNVTSSSEAIYLKLEVVGEKATYYVATQPDFSDAATKAQTITGLDAKTLGFFATAGTTAIFSDIMVTSSVTEEDVTTNKIVFDSETGELIPEYKKSTDFAGTCTPNFTFETAVDGNILKVDSIRAAGTTDKGTIREDKNMEYLLFPATTENMTITADVTITKLDTGTDKQGIAIGQFDAAAGSAMHCDVIHGQKNKVYQHTFHGTAGGGACGDPKSAALEDMTGGTYTLTYTKTGNISSMRVVSASGTEVLNGTFDLTQDFTTLQDGQSVRYGFAFCGVSADIANIKLLNAAGEVVYDQNDYYIAVGVAPVLTSATAAVAEDRTAINVDWTIGTEGSGNIQYTVYASKDGGAYAKVGSSKVNSFAYTPEGDGTYKFKVVGKGGDTEGNAVETDSVAYQAPLAKPVLTGTATASQVVLEWEAVPEAVNYKIYKALGSDNQPAFLTNVSALTYTDTAVEAEEPYYYYVVATNSQNSSNPSNTVQMLTSNGHSGAYVYEDAATKLTVVSKSNDTIMDTKAGITLKADEAGTAVLNVNGAKSGEQNVEANVEFTFNFNLKQARNDVELLFTDADGNTTRKIFNFVSNPKIDIVVDAAYTGVEGAVTDGYPTYATVEAAVNSVPADNVTSKVIFIKNGEYDERVTVESPYVSLLGEDAEKTHLFYAVCIAYGNADSMWNRNAMYVDSTADGFTAENLTIENSYAYTNGSDQQADALCIVADQTLCVNVRLIGYQDTLLTDSRVKDASGNYEITRQYFDKCYITGNVDFIYGAGTSVFNDCDIVARYTEYKADGCFTAARTYITTPYGYVFNNCHFLAEEGVEAGAYRLARPWGADASTTFVNCYMSAVVTEVGYGDMSGNSYKNARFAEYGSYGPGYAVNADRALLSSSQAENHKAANVLSGFSYEAAENGLYVAATYVDTTAFAKAILEGSALMLNASKYESVTELSKALAAATAVQNEVAGWTSDRQAELDGYTKAINSAIAGLIEKKPAADDNNDNNNNDNSDDSDDSDDSDESAAPVQEVVITAPVVSGTTADWSGVIAQVAQAAEGTTVTLDLTKTSEQTNIVSKAVMNSIAGKDVTIQIQMPNVKWTINGKNVKNAADVDFGVKTNVNNIPENLIRSVAEGKETIQLSLDYDGDFGFEATLTVVVGQKNAGKIANLFYLNSQNALEYMGSSVIGANGMADWNFTHASEYVIVVDDKPYQAAVGTVVSVAQTGDNAQAAGESVATGDSTPIVLYVVLAVVALLVAVGAIAGTVWYRKKKKA